MPGDEKTEKATPKKRSDARKKGEVLQSKEVMTAVSIIALFVTLSIYGKNILVRIQHGMKSWINEMSYVEEVNVEYLTNSLIKAIIDVIICCWPLFLVSIIVAIIVTIMQTRGLFSTESMKFKFSKLNPFTGIKRVFSIQSIVNILKGLLTVGILAYIIYSQFMDRISDFAKMTDVDLIQGVWYVGDAVMAIIVVVGVLFVFLAAGDYIFQWYQFEKKLKMSKQEVKDEYKQLEGDPQIKAKIKQRQRQMAMARMMQNVPTADVVIRNPTHYAVAISYDPQKHNAPRVVAKGVDYIAMRIVKIAEENDVYIKEDRELARTLYDTVKVDSEIPFALYTAIAELLAVVYEIKNKKIL